MQSAPPEDAPVGGQVVVAISPGTLSPDMYGGWSNNATNSGFIGLMSGYALADYNRDYVLDWDPVVVKDHEVIENDDGSKTYRFEINDNLKWSDGSPITAKDYVFSLLLHSSPEFAACEGDATYGWALVGYNDHVQGTTKEFAGVNLLGDYEFSMTINADQLPNYYEMANVAYGPEPLAAIAPGCDVKDDGNGAYLTDGFTEDLIRETLLDPDKGFRYKAPVVCGPYKLKSVDLTTETVELEINEEYLGTYDGTKPHIQTIISKPVADETIRDEFEKGTIDFYSAGTGEKIEAALTKVEEGKLDANYGLVPGTRINEMRYMCDFGPTQFEEVRRAIAYIVDRDEINKQLTGGYGTVVDCYATDATTDFAAIKDDIESELIHYSYDLDKAKECLEAAGYSDTDGDGIVDKDGENLSLTISISNGSSTAVSETLQDMWKQIGVDVQIEMLENVSDKRAAGDFDMLVSPNWQTVNAGDGQKYLMNRWSDGGSDNYSGYHSDEFQAVLDKLDAAFTQEDRVSAFVEAQQVLADDAPAIWMYANENVTLVNSKIENVTVFPIDYYLVTNKWTLAE